MITKTCPRVAMVHTQLAGVILYRMQNFAKYLMKRKIPCVTTDYNLKSMQMSMWETVIMNPKFKVLDTLEKFAQVADIMIWQKFCEGYSLATVDAIRHKYPGVKMVMEIDDYAFNVPQWNQAVPYYQPGSDLFRICQEQLMQAEAVIVSTNYLKNAYIQYNKNIYVVENSIDFDFWGKPRNDNGNNKKVRIGWSGSFAHRADLDILTPVINQILDEIGDKCEFYFFGAKYGVPDLKRDGVIYDHNVTDLTLYPEAMKRKGFDIGLAPLRDHEFNRGKSANRMIEYGMQGVPTIASDIGGQYNEIIKHGENGMLAATPDDWVKCIRELVLDKELRGRMGKSAFNTIKNEHNAEKNIDKFIAVLNEINKL